METEFDPYNIPFRGITMDPYLVLELFQITDPAIQQAIKKLLRCGRKHKDADQDCEETITSLVRRREVKRILRASTASESLLAASEKAPAPSFPVFWINGPYTQTRIGCMEDLRYALSERSPLSVNAILDGLKLNEPAVLSPGMEPVFTTTEGAREGWISLREFLKKRLPEPLLAGLEL